MKAVLLRVLRAYGRAPLSIRSLAIVVWGGLIWWASSHSHARPMVAGVPVVEPDDVLWSFVGNGGHVVVFGILAALIFMLFRGRAWWRPSLAVALSSAYGFIDEWHQSYVQGRHSSLWDWVSDTSGSLFACALLIWLLFDSVTARRWSLVFVPLCLASVAIETLGPSVGP